MFSVGDRENLLHCSCLLQRNKSNRGAQVSSSTGEELLLITQAAFRRFIELNRSWSRKLDTLLDPRGRRGDGMLEFAETVQSTLRPGMVVIDVGGGKRPAITPEVKASLGLRVIGVDISQEEIDLAPPGSYDETICGDLTRSIVLPEADLAISRSVTEHVTDPSAMYLNIFQTLRPGGYVISCIPNKFAMFALVNAAMPNRLTKALLSSFHWETKEETGFPAFYRQCYPSALEAIMKGVGFRNVQTRPSSRSEYCNFFAPLHTLELLWQIFTSRLKLRNLCEVFTIVAQKES